MVASGLAGAASASAATHRHRPAAVRAGSAGSWAPASRVRPAIANPPSAVTATATAPVTATTAALSASASVAAPSVTITDPGLIPTGDTVTLALDGPHYTPGTHVTFDTAYVPVVTVSGPAITGPVTITATTISFSVTKSATTTSASYTVSGIHLTGTAGAQAGSLYAIASASHSNVSAPPTTDVTVAPVALAAVTDLLPAFYGNTAPDTAAKLFAVTAAKDVSSVVLASDAEPQDAESANYLEAEDPGTQSGILLTDPTTLSPAVSSTFTAFRRSRRCTSSAARVSSPPVSSPSSTPFSEPPTSSGSLAPPSTTPTPPSSTT